LKGQGSRVRSVPVPVAVPEDFKKWPLMLLYAALVFGEARGEPYEAKVAVAWVVRNRFIKGGWFGKDLRSVILKPWQFSCFNQGDPNREKLKNPLFYEPFNVWAECYEIAEKVHQGEVKDPTEGATHYFDEAIKRKPPSWAKKLKFKKKIGDFYFYG